ncbi:hypothetical protein [Streptomyces sp. NPDC001770]
MPPRNSDAGRHTPSWRSIFMIMVVLGGICGVICLLVALGLPVGAAIGAVGGLMAAAVAVVHPPQRLQDFPRERTPAGTVPDPVEGPRPPGERPPAGGPRSPRRPSADGPDEGTGRGTA